MSSLRIFWRLCLLCSDVCWLDSQPILTPPLWRLLLSTGARPFSGSFEHTRAPNPLVYVFFKIKQPAVHRRQGRQRNRSLASYFENQPQICSRRFRLFLGLNVPAHVFARQSEPRAQLWLPVLWRRQTKFLGGGRVLSQVRAAARIWLRLAVWLRAVTSQQCNAARRRSTSKLFLTPGGDSVLIPPCSFLMTRVSLVFES